MLKMFFWHFLAILSHSALFIILWFIIAQTIFECYACVIIISMHIMALSILISVPLGNALPGPSSTILYRMPETLRAWPGLQHLSLCLRGSGGFSSTSLYNILNNCIWLKSLVILLTDSVQTVSSTDPVHEDTSFFIFSYCFYDL